LITVMLSPATRLSNTNGPTQTGSVPSSSPSLAGWVGDMMIPDGPVRFAVSGVNGVFRRSTTVDDPTAVTVSIGSRALAREEPGSAMLRSIVVTTACASNGVPSLKRIPVRSGIV
jgi:hypothetical protein